MAGTPKRAGRVAADGSEFLSEVAARNVKHWRALRGLTQEQLAELVARLGHGWVRATVSEVERNGRTISIDELAGLAAALNVSVAALLDSRGPTRSRGSDIDVGGSMPVPVPIAHDFVLAPHLNDDQAAIIATHVGLWSISPQEEPMNRTSTPTDDVGGSR